MIYQNIEKKFKCIEQIDDYICERAKRSKKEESEDDIDNEEFKIGCSGVKKAKAVNPCGKTGAYGILFYGSGIQYGVTYYSLPYAIYEDEDKNEIIIYGKSIIEFTPSRV